MTTSASSFAYQPGTNAAFQTCVQTIDTAIITTFGWVNSADTGQIDPLTVAKPASNADAGYRIYNTNDGGGLTTWYVKIIYGLDASGNLRLKVSLATGTNGSGTLSGQTSAVFTWDWTAPPASPTNLAMSGTTGRLMIFIGSFNSNRSANGFSIHRTVDGTGVATDDGMEFFYAPSSGVACQFIPKTGTIPSAESNRFPVIFTSGNTAVIGANVRFGHPILFGSSSNNNPSLAVMVWASADLSPVTLTTKTLSVYSGSRVYLLDGDTHNSVFNGGNTRIGWRYE